MYKRGVHMAQSNPPTRAAPRRSSPDPPTSSDPNPMSLPPPVNPNNNLPTGPHNFWQVFLGMGLKYRKEDHVRGNFCSTSVTSCLQKSHHSQHTIPPSETWRNSVWWQNHAVGIPFFGRNWKAH
ncbi:hypothetical protein AMECASPLE_019115 [Ameca splendens]|uniref:Uncharacterized protein n=1 Tax=Ameca splendens TaxID=208324 RepID=A0ABV0Z119_9TELE